MPDPKPGALPLGDAPIKLKIFIKQNLYQFGENFDTQAAKRFLPETLANLVRRANYSAHYVVARRFQKYRKRLLRCRTSMRVSLHNQKVFVSLAPLPAQFQKSPAQNHFSILTAVNTTNSLRRGKFKEYFLSLYLSSQPHPSRRRHFGSKRQCLA